jgi:hypothetical protein
MKTQELLNQLQADTRALILKVNHLQKEEQRLLLRKISPDKWSVAQIIEHLKSYGNYYLPEIKKALETAETSGRPAKAEFTPGWLGNYFTRIMLPDKDGKITNRMQAPSDHWPAEDLDGREVLNQFLQQQYMLLEYLERARRINIGGVRIPISISRLIRLKLGDTFRFYIAHQQRHFFQIAHTLEALNVPTGIYRAVHQVV